MSVCSRCGAEKGERKHRWCIDCYNRHRNTRWRAKKIALAERRGGACTRCGWKPASRKEYAALDFHHRDPATKDMSIAGNWLLTKNAEAEAEKCDLLCARCHRIHHAQNDWDE